MSLNNIKIYILFALALFYANVGYSQDVNLDSLSFNGFYQELLTLKCDHLPLRSKQDAKTNVSFVKPIDSEFYRKIANEKIIIINESHLDPQSRAFTHSLLTKLLEQPNQYYVFFEALNFNGDVLGKSTLNNTKEQGYYFQEPQMAENLRLVLRYKHNAYAYEDNLSGEINFDAFYDLGLSNRKNDSLVELIVANSHEKNGMIASMNIRDFNQFINFYKHYKDITAKNPRAQFIIIVGHGHINELPVMSYDRSTWYPFACILRNILNINPCTIETTEFLPKCESDKNPFYDIIYKSVPNPNKYYYMTNVDLVDNKSEIAEFIGDLGNYFIISPEPLYTNRRPSWLFDAGRKVFTVPISVLKGVKKGTAIKAYYSNEDYKQTTPADILHVNSLADNTLLLYPGNYKIVNGATRKILIPSVTIPSPK